MRFDYLHDAVPDGLRELRALRLPRRLHTIAAALLTTAVVVAFGSGIETIRLAQARALESQLQLRFDTTRGKLQSAQLAWQQLDELIARDRRLRDIRLSGTVVAQRLVRIGNVFPKRAWLTSMSAAASTYTLKGYALDLPVFANALQGLVNSAQIGQPKSIRISRDDRARNGVLAFEVRQEPTR